MNIFKNDLIVPIQSLSVIKCTILKNLKSENLGKATKKGAIFKKKTEIL